MTDRAVSVTVNYVLTLTIATLLLSGLVVSAGGIIESESERAIQSELEVLGQKLAADIESADRLATINETENTEVVSVEIETRLPTRVAGTEYTITVNETAGDLELQTTGPDVEVSVEFRIRDETNVEFEQPIRGGDVLIEWKESDTLVVKSA